jgi:GT2 family glycosyltransferase
MARRAVDELAVAVAAAHEEAGLLADAVCSLASDLERAEAAWREDGAAEGVGRAPRPWRDAASDPEEYRRWLRLVEPPPRPPGSALGDPRLLAGPVVSVVIPVHEPDLRLLRRAIDSCLRQTYPRLEVCCCDDGSKQVDATRFLRRVARRHRRVRFVRREQNGGISAATNEAARLATGEWIAFLDQDDELAPFALEEVVRAILDAPDADVLYSDEDKIDLVGLRQSPAFKPDYSPDLLLSCMYACHLFVVRRALFEELGGLRSEFDGSQDFDLALRAVERARRVVHVPKVLYHWREHAGSAAGSAEAKPWASEAGRRAVQAALERRGERGRAVRTRWPGIYAVRREVQGNPLVTVVIAARDAPRLTASCLDALEATAGWDPYEVVLIDNGSVEPETHALLVRLERTGRARVVLDPRPFNWSALANHGAAEAHGEVLLFLNNDVLGERPGWMRAMLEHAMRPSIGAVGAQLRYPDGTLQHTGHVLGLLGGPANHVMRGLPPDSPGYLGWAVATRNWSALTGACMMLRRAVFEQAGGFDESLGVACNDVDLCLRLGARGYRHVVVPEAVLQHAESASRGTGGYGPDVDAFVARWREALEAGDPLFNPNLSLLDAACTLRFPGEEVEWEEKLARLTRSWRP